MPRRSPNAKILAACVVTISSKAGGSTSRVDAATRSSSKRVGEPVTVESVPSATFTLPTSSPTGAAGAGPVAAREAELLRREPAYGNLAELGLGVLAGFGVEPLGEILIDEKLGLHIAFGRSDHFGGRVGAADFSRPEAVVHLDRVYLPATQPRVRVPRVDLTIDGTARALMRDGVYAAGVLG